MDTIVLHGHKIAKGKRGYEYQIVKTPSHNPIRTSKYQPALPTILIALDLEISDTFFKPPNIFASIKINEPEKVDVCVEVVDPSRRL